MIKVVLVDKNDKEIGEEEKIKAHLKKGKLHRAFTILIFNNQNQILLQKRSKQKMLWPSFWDASCSSHPFKNESYQEAGKRRLKEELGFSCPLKLIGKFQYQASYKNIGSENEICAVLSGKFKGEIKPNPNEIAEVKWIDFNEVIKDIKNNSQKYTPWFKITIEKFENKIKNYLK